MNLRAKKFVFSKKNTKISDSIKLEKDDVGIIEAESEESFPIFFVRIWQKVLFNKNAFKIFDVYLDQLGIWRDNHGERVPPLQGPW